MPVRDVVNLKAHVPHDFYIGRGSPWGNPFRIGPDGNREDVLVRYEHWIRTTRPDLLRRLTELDGKVLGCYCDPQPCHGHVLARLLVEWETGGPLRCNRCWRPMLGTTAYDGACECGGLIERTP